MSTLPIPISILIFLAASHLLIGAEGDDIEIAVAKPVAYSDELANYIAVKFDDASKEDVIFELKNKGVNIELIPDVVVGPEGTFTMVATKVRLIDVLLVLSSQCSVTVHWNKNTGHITVRHKGPFEH